jgi:hypothetical protein
LSSAVLPNVALLFRACMVEAILEERVAYVTSRMEIVLPANVRG